MIGPASDRSRRSRLSEPVQPGALTVVRPPSEGAAFFLCRDVVGQAAYQRLASAFDDVDWERRVTEFYSQYEALVTPASASPLAGLYGREFCSVIRSRVAKILGISLREEVRVIAHRLVTDDVIDVHNDYCDPGLGFERVRLVIQFASRSSVASGGEIHFLASEDAHDVIARCPVEPNSGVCFEITPTSYHFVSAVKGVRDSVVIYLWDRERPYDGSGFTPR